jgi:hypothetical protein
MTFRRILSSIYGDSFHLCADPSIHAVKAALAKFNCIEFHPMPYNGYWTVTHSELAKQQRWDLLEACDVFTMLRDPVDQFLSEYFYLVKIKNQLEPVLKARGIEFPSSLFVYTLSPAVYNEQTSFLAGSHPKAEIVDQDDLARAKETLLCLNANVGLTERFADSMNVFETVTGLNIPDHMIQDQNRNPDRPPLESIPSKTREAIRERSKLDTELYEFGREMFQEQLSRCGPTRRYTFIQDAPDNITKSSISAESNSHSPPPAQATGKCVFMHIPRTAGVTFRECLLSTYEYSYLLCYEPSIDSIQAMFAEYDCLEFHALPYRGDIVYLHSELARLGRWDLFEGADIFTMLRDPVDQALSQYFHMMKLRDFLEPYQKAHGITFPENLDAYLDFQPHFNGQLSFLLGRYPLTQKDTLKHSDLAEAKNILVRLGVHVGLSERFADSLHIFETVTGRRLPAKIRNRNENPDRPLLADIPDKVKERIREQSALDLELYQFGQELFLEDLRRCGPPRQYNFVSAPVAALPAMSETNHDSTQSVATIVTQNAPIKPGLGSRVHSSLTRLFGKRSTLS